ncbi:hypothetical protein [Desulfobacter sp.]|uniref:hypothetical protein n=1 Tax=Desulfobacter sp. TaxID=2294 RepID=UPI003D0A3FA8
MRYSPSINDSPCCRAFLAFILLLAVAACSTGQPEMNKAGGEFDAVKTAAPSVSKVDKLQGRWRSRSDTCATIEIKGNIFLSLYNEEIVSNGVLTFVNNCQERFHDPQGQFFIVSNEADALCYHLTVVGDTFLEYVYIPRGTTLSYERIE